MPEKRCSSCGIDFGQKNNVSSMDVLLCNEWANEFLMDSSRRKHLPSLDHFEALQRAGFIPTKVEMDATYMVEVTLKNYTLSEQAWAKIAEKVYAKVNVR